MALLLHHPILFHNTKRTTTLLHKAAPVFKTLRNRPVKCGAVAAPEISGDGKEDVLVDEERGRVHVVGYDWTEEWYPLYLTKNVPEDAPLGLTVFDKQVVLFRDGNGDLQCYEDRCPHRYFDELILNFSWPDLFIVICFGVLVYASIYDQVPDLLVDGY